MSALTSVILVRRVQVANVYHGPASEDTKDIIMVFDTNRLNPPMGGRSRAPDGDCANFVQANPVR
jgi:hypothetical protein